MSNVFERLGYRASQSARVAWYMAHYALAARLAPPLSVQAAPQRQTPDRAALLHDIRALFAQDWRNIEAGIYAPPQDLLGSPRRLLSRSRLFFRDVPRVAKRRAARTATEVRSTAQTQNYPLYYLQNFHYQTDGYLSEESAALYDFQVETLFSGTADAMRRQALVPLAHALSGRDQRTVSLLDVACGTGRFLSFVKQNYPCLPAIGIDLSPDYLAEARRALDRYRGVDLFRANAEALPLAEASQDIVSCIYLFHELPEAIRSRVAHEIARVLKPGGLLIFMDSLQLGDHPPYDGLLELFPERFHEPYYRAYLREDLVGRFAETGLRLEETHNVFLSKLCVFRKV